MRSNANCSEMVLTSLTIVLYSSRLAMLLEGYRVYLRAKLFTMKFQVGVWPLLALQTYVTSVIITAMN